MALGDIHWGKVLEALELRARELDLGPTDLVARLQLLKDHWEMLSDEAALDVYIRSRRLAELIVMRDQLQEQLDIVIAEIELLQQA